MTISVLIFSKILLPISACREQRVSRVGGKRHTYTPHIIRSADIIVRWKRGPIPVTVRVFFQTVHIGLLWWSVFKNSHIDSLGISHVKLNAVLSWPPQICIRAAWHCKEGGITNTSVTLSTWWLIRHHKKAQLYNPSVSSKVIGVVIGLRIYVILYSVSSD